MNPKYIFSAVFAVAVMMMLVLPQLGAGSSSAAGSPALAAGAALPEAAAAISYGAGISYDAAPPTSQPLPATPTQAVADPPPAGDSSAASDSSAAGSSSDSIPLTALTTPELQAFAAELVNERPGEVVGLYAPGLFALPVTQQPAGDFNFISPFDGVLTQYAPPQEHGAIGLLAHNYLSGRAFFDLQTGRELVVVFGDGQLARYRVTALDRYQALSPLDPYSDFIDLQDAGAARQSFQVVYDRYYRVTGQLVLQTCIEHNGDLSWGRLFVVAEPL